MSAGYVIKDANKSLVFCFRAFKTSRLNLKPARSSLVTGQRSLEENWNLLTWYRKWKLLLITLPAMAVSFKTKRVIK